VSSANTDAVLRYNGQTGTFIDQFVPSGAIGIVRPTDLLVHSGQLYVGAWSGDVHRYDLATGAFIDKFVGTGSGGLVQPAGIDFGPDGNFYVADADFSAQHNVILRYDGQTGAFIDEFVPAGTGGMGGPGGIIFGPDGNLYVVSNSRVLQFNGLTGAYQKDFVAQGQGGMNAPTRLTFDGNQVFVVNSGTDQVLRYDVPAWAAFTDY
jgi:DNA-binding beta-propeller fold protein YncE